MYCFGEFEIDLSRREVRRGGEPVHLEPQAFDVLVYLVEHQDRVVDKVELLDRVWGHSFLSETNLTTRIKEIRRALGDDGTQQRVVKNYRGRGYRFVEQVNVARSLSDRSAESDLIGRGPELHALVDALQRSRLVTVVGAGGVGKSALASVVSALADHEYRDGIHVVELASIASGEELLPSIARVLNVLFDGDSEHDAIRSAARLHALLLLDNCEHVIDDVSTFVDRILSVIGGGISVLATSRVRLGLSSEILIPLGPLTVDHGSELFTLRARSVDPLWDPAAVGLDRVAKMISSLDLLPLTIEMAAGRMGSMTFDDLDGAIAKGLSLLQMTHRSKTVRHRSLESLVEWSAERLNSHQREVFTRFSVFAGAVTADDAASVVTPGVTETVMFDLAALSEHSLLVVDRSHFQTRYSMSATVRTVAEHWLNEAGLSDDVRLRHAEHVAEVLLAIDDQIRTPNEHDGRRRLDACVDEVRAAHRWARHNNVPLASCISGALFHAANSSLWLEPAEWSQMLLSGQNDRIEPACAGALIMAASAAAHRGYLAAARESAKTVAEMTHGRMRVNAIELLADVALYEGDLEGASRAGLELQRLGDELGDAHAATFGTVDIALALVYGGDPTAALEQLLQFQAVELAPTDGAWLAYALGDALSALHDPSAAAAYLDAIELGASVGNRFVISVSRTGLATQYARSGDLVSGLNAFRDTLRDYVRHGNHTHAVTALRNLIGVFTTIGEDRGAIMLAGAMSNGGLRVSYGTEVEQVAEMISQIESRVGSSHFGAWFTEGQLLDVDAAVQLAMELVDTRQP